MTYNPVACGALCHLCPLQGKTVVPPEANVSDLTKMAAVTGTIPIFALVGEAPGEMEEKFGKPFVGPSGMELDSAMRSAGLKRRDCHVTNVLLCRPDDNKLTELLTKINKDNKEKEKNWRDSCEAAEKTGYPKPPEPTYTMSPIDCCRPRLEKELADFDKFVTLGKTATQAVTGRNESIMNIRGALQELEATERTPRRLVLPTLHPSFILRTQKWAHVFRSDLHKASRAFRGQAAWQPPKVTYHPPPDVLRAFLSDPNRIYTYDLETDGIESLTARIRCIGIGDEKEVMLVGILGKDGHRRFYLPAEERQIRQILKDFFNDDSKVKAGHNIGYYDRLVLRSQWDCDPMPIVDTILLHKSVESELPHGLAYVGSLYTDAPAWKSDREGNKLATGSESDEQLHEYCSVDVAVTAAVLPQLVDQVRLRDQMDVWRMDQRIQVVCADMHAVGMFVDQTARLKEEKKMLQRRHELLAQVRDRLHMPNFNPGSTQQLRAILFDKWKLEAPLEEEERFTSSGDPSTADLVLRSLLTSHDVPDDKREIIKLIRYYRKVQKVLGTYVVKLRPQGIKIEEDLGWYDDDEDYIDKETRKKYGLAKEGIVDPRTGRMHPGYNAHVAVTGRLSSSKPINAQNFPKGMRGMVCAAPGHVLVGADMDQLELRIAAARWQVQLYLRAFAEGKDPHSMTAFAVFGEEFCKAAGLDAKQFEHAGPLVGTSYKNGKFEGTGDDKKMRDLSKAVQYASQYMATVETVHKLICKTEIPSKTGDGTTDLPYALLPLRRVRVMRDNWLKGAYEFENGWEREIHTFRKTGYIREPVTGRRRDFLDGEAPNEIVNFPIQSSAAGLMNRAILQIHEQVPLHKWGPGTGIINQCHDSIVIECPESEAEGVARLMEEAMNQTHPDLPGVTFTATAEIGQTWKQVG